VAKQSIKATAIVTTTTTIVAAIMMGAIAVENQ